MYKLKENMGEGANDYHWTFRPTGIEQQRSYELTKYIRLPRG